ncbi:universal stress protein, partial [Halorubrum sp. AJ67]|uniref:universal stress protein n=1 Tax=Halorubrum sp. AJ67 TaxID=1173487 RepID=UPI0018966F34
MSKRILVAIDGSAEATEALRFAAEEWPDADLTALHVINPADVGDGGRRRLPGGLRSVVRKRQRARRADPRRGDGSGRPPGRDETGGRTPEADDPRRSG